MGICIYVISMSVIIIILSVIIIKQITNICEVEHKIWEKWENDDDK